MLIPFKDSVWLTHLTLVVYFETHFVSWEECLFSNLNWSGSLDFTAQHGAENCFSGLDPTCLSKPCCSLVFLNFLPFGYPSPASKYIFLILALPPSPTPPSFFYLFPCDCIVALRQISSGGSLAAAASLKLSAWLQVQMQRVSASMVEDYEWLSLSVSTCACLTWLYCMTVSVVHCAVIIPWKSLKLNIRTDFASFCHVSPSNMTNHMLSNPVICLLTPMKSLYLNSIAAVDWPQVAPHLFSFGKTL